MCTSAHAPALTVSGQDQPRGAGFKPLIEEGCGPRLFVQTLKRLQHPAEEPVVLGTRLQQALTIVREQGCNIENFREMRMQKIREKAAELDHLREGYQKVLHPRVKAVIGHLHLPLLDWLLREIGFEDEDYLASLMRGRPVLGQAADSSANVACWFTCEVDLEEWAKNPRARNEQMLRKIRPSKDGSDKAAWDKTKKAISKGYERGPYAIHRKNLDEVCFTPRFAKWEQKEDGSWTARNITDLKASGANSTVEVLRKYCPEDLTQALALHRAIREQMPVGTRIMGYRADWEMAFRQDPTDPTQAKLLVELQWNPERKAACATESDGQPFGGKATQYNFIRDHQAMVAIGRSALALVVSHYSDDTWGLEPDYAALHEWKIWLELHKIIGWRLDLDKSSPNLIINDENPI